MTADIMSDGRICASLFTSVFYLRSDDRPYEILAVGVALPVDLTVQMIVQLKTYLIEKSDLLAKYLTQ
jgi:hypothetical protein